MDRSKQIVTRLSQVDSLVNDDDLKEQWMPEEFELNTDKENLSPELNCLLEESEETLKVAINDGNEKEVAEKDAIETIEKIKVKNKELHKLLDYGTTEQSRKYESQVHELNEQLERTEEFNNNKSNTGAISEDGVALLKEKISLLEVELQEKENRIGDLEHRQTVFQDVYSNEKEKLEERICLLENEHLQSIKELTNQLNDIKESVASSTLPGTDFSLAAATSAATPTSPTSIPTTARIASSTRRRKQHVMFTAEEDQYLKDGIKKYGLNWVQILESYPFHESRSNNSLYHKHRQMKRREKKKKKPVMIRQCASKAKERF